MDEMHWEETRPAAAARVKMEDFILSDLRGGRGTHSSLLLVGLCGNSNYGRYLCGCEPPSNEQ